MAEVGAVFGRVSEVEGCLHAGLCADGLEDVRLDFSLEQHLPVLVTDDRTVVADGIVVANAVVVELRRQHAEVTPAHQAELVAGLTPGLYALYVRLRNGIVPEQRAIVVAGCYFHDSASLL